MNKRAKEWIKRYLPAEILSFALTIVAVLTTSLFTQNKVAIALWGTWAGNVGYFGYILAADIIVARKAVNEAGGQYSFKTFLKNIRALFAEFGLAEVFDSLLIRPALMYYLPIFLGDLVSGTIVAKLIADLTFYVPAIISYELTKSRFRKFH
jgi:hypothetical protein